MEENITNPKENRVIDPFQSVLNYARENHADEIDKAYEYFWEEDYPEDFLTGMALDIAFVNFEDWLIHDYRNRDGDSLIDLYKKDNKVADEESRLLNIMKESLLSLYEIISQGKEGINLKDLLLGEELVLNDETGLMTHLHALPPGYIFATRLGCVHEFTAGSGDPAEGRCTIMGKCIYPFGPVFKDTVLDSIDSVFKRYKKNKNPKGTMRDFLKDEAYIFNTIWMSNLYKGSKA